MIDKKKDKIKNKIKNRYELVIKKLQAGETNKKTKQNIQNKTMKKSFSPYINRKLDINSLKTLKHEKINLCNSLIKINLGSVEKPRCLSYNNIEVIKFLLKNLKSTKHLDPSKFIAPKQLYSNCWFNTMFVSFFFSDKGRKFFRFFRNLMITGRKYDGSRLKDQHLRVLLFVFNLYIEASYNQNSNKTLKNRNKNKTLKNRNNLHDQVKNLTANLETNFLIKKIYNRIKEINPKYNLPNINEAGNPLEYYKVIMIYLNYNVLNIKNVDVLKNSKKIYKNTDTIFKNTLLKNKKKCDIFIFEDHESKMDYMEEYEVELNNKIYKYVLDSIILTNKDHYNPKANSHFVSVLTINKEGYKFDGSSYSKLSKFNWKKILNKNIDFTFKENPNYYPEKYNFKYGYKILFYYRKSI